MRVHIPYLIASALSTSQLIPPMLIHRTLAQLSRWCATGSCMRATKSAFTRRRALSCVPEKSHISIAHSW